MLKVEMHASLAATLPARTYSWLAGALFLGLAGLIFVTWVGAGGVSVDITFVAGPWVIGLTAVGLTLLIAPGIRFTLALAASFGLGSAAFWAWAITQSSDGFRIGWGLAAVLALTGSLTAIEGLFVIAGPVRADQRSLRMVRELVRAVWLVLLAVLVFVFVGVFVFPGLLARPEVEIFEWNTAIPT